MSHWRDMPKRISRKQVLETIGFEGMDKWRNPMRIPNVCEGWPTPGDRSPTFRDRNEEFSRTLGMEKSITGKSPL